MERTKRKNEAGHSNYRMTNRYWMMGLKPLSGQNEGDRQRKRREEGGEGTDQ